MTRFEKIGDGIDQFLAIGHAKGYDLYLDIKADSMKEAVEAALLYGLKKTFWFEGIDPHDWDSLEDFTQWLAREKYAKEGWEISPMFSKLRVFQVKAEAEKPLDDWFELFNTIKENAVAERKEEEERLGRREEVVGYGGLEEDQDCGAQDGDNQFGSEDKQDNGVLMSLAASPCFGHEFGDRVDEAHAQGPGDGSRGPQDQGEYAVVGRSELARHPDGDDPRRGNHEQVVEQRQHRVLDQRCAVLLAVHRPAFPVTDS